MANAQETSSTFLAKPSMRGAMFLASRWRPRLHVLRNLAVRFGIWDSSRTKPASEFLDRPTFSVSWRFPSVMGTGSGAGKKTQQWELSWPKDRQTESDASTKGDTGYGPLSLRRSSTTCRVDASEWPAQKYAAAQCFQHAYSCSNGQRTDFATGLDASYQDRPRSHAARIGDLASGSAMRWAICVGPARRH